MSEIRPELHLWVAYLEKKEQLEEAQDRIEELEAALRFYADDNYNGYNGNGAHARALLEGGKKE